MLSFGQAWMQSRQKVQSMLPAFRGTNRFISQPRFGLGGGLPRMQSLVSQLVHTAGWRTRNGEQGDAPEPPAEAASAAPAVSTPVTLTGTTIRDCAEPQPLQQPLTEGARQVGQDRQDRQEGRDRQDPR